MNARHALYQMPVATVGMTLDELPHGATRLVHAPQVRQSRDRHGSARVGMRTRRAIPIFTGSSPLESSLLVRAIQVLKLCEVLLGRRRSTLLVGSGFGRIDLTWSGRLRSCRIARRTSCGGGRCFHRFVERATLRSFEERESDHRQYVSAHTQPRPRPTVFTEKFHDRKRRWHLSDTCPSRVCHVLPSRLPLLWTEVQVFAPPDCDHFNFQPALYSPRGTSGRTGQRFERALTLTVRVFG